MVSLMSLKRSSSHPIATFKAGNERKTTHRHLYLPKDYSGSPTASLYTPWTEAEVLTHLATGWGEGAISRAKAGVSLRARA